MLWPWLMAFGIPFPLLALRAEKYYRRMPVLPAETGHSGTLPALTVIVPARNEAKNLPVLLPSLLSQQYPGELEILVVDDHSDDGTGEIARAHGVPVLKAPELPQGWLGKPHACHTGALAARGEWLLFTDADTQHDQDGLRRSVEYALDHGLDGLSLLLREQTFGLLDKTALMTAFAALFAGFRTGQPMLNGQFILLRTDVYREVGGFAAVRSEPIEDLALAHLLQKAGRSAPILIGYDAGQVRMYGGPQHLWQGLKRLGAGSLKWSGPGGWLTALFITGALLPLVGILFVLWLEMPPAWLALSWAVVVLAFLPWAVRSGHWLYAALAPFGALTVQLAALTGLTRSTLGLGIPWKGRNV